MKSPLSRWMPTPPNGQSVVEEARWGILFQQPEKRGEGKSFRQLKLQAPSSKRRPRFGAWCLGFGVSFSHLSPRATHSLSRHLSPQPSPRSCFAGRASWRIQRWWLYQHAPVVGMDMIQDCGRSEGGAVSSVSFGCAWERRVASLAVSPNQAMAPHRAQIRAVVSRKLSLSVQNFVFFGTK
jgi:hypothetical protein